MTTIAGISAIGWSVFLLLVVTRGFSPRGIVLATFVYGILAGVYAITRVTAADLRRLPTAAVWLTVCFFLCDAITALIAVFAAAFLHNSKVQKFLVHYSARPHSATRSESTERKTQNA